MESDGPVSAVQVRLAKGEISTTEYKEIITHLMKNVSSFQQTSSLKILQVRYAKSEITSDQYQENFTHLMKKLYSQPWSPPLHILHVRYAEGEIDTTQYNEMFTNLTQEQFTYEQSTPLWILNNRYAKGELITQEYEEILSLFTDYTQSLQQSTMKLPEGLQNPAPPETRKEASPEKTAPTQPAPERSSLNLKTASLKTAVVSETIALRHGDSDLDTYDEFADHPVSFSPSKVKTEPLPEAKSSPAPAPAEVSTPLTGELSESVEEVAAAAKQPLSSEMVSIPGLKIEGSPSSEPLKFSSTLSTASSAGSEALPSEFLSLGIRSSPAQAAPVIEPAGRAGSEVAAESTVADGVPSALAAENGETVLAPEVPAEGSAELADVIPGAESVLPESEGKVTPDAAEIRQKIKTLIVKGNYQEAVDLAETMIGEEDNDYLPHFYKGMARYYLNIHTEALADLDHARELCKNKDEIRKIDTIRNHILLKQRKDAESAEEGSAEAEEAPLAEASGADAGRGDSSPGDDLSQRLDTLGKKAQDLIDKKEYKSAKNVLGEFLNLCSGLSKDRLQAESVDEIYAAMGYVRYQLKDYSNAKECFQEALGINAENEVANNYMKDILIRAARKK